MPPISRDERRQVDYILERVNNLWDENAEYRKMADVCQQMWELNPGFDTNLQEAVLKGREQVIVPTPYTTVNMGQRLLESKPEIQYVPQGKTEELDKDGEIVERWLTYMWDEVNYQQKKNVISNMIWHILVRGRFAVEVKWIEHAMPRLRKGINFPIAINPLDPKDVCVYEGPYGVEYAAHKTKKPLLDIIQLDADMKRANVPSELNRLIESFEKDKNKGDEYTELEVIDYWYIEDGDVYNAIIVEDCFAKPPSKTTYPDIPLIVGYGDYGITGDNHHRGMSILYPMRDLWLYHCRLSSQMASGLMWHFWPAINISSEFGEPPDDIIIGPGKINYLPAGVSVDVVRQDGNVPLAQSVQGMIEQFTQQVGWPEVMYGKAPGELQAGYGVSILADAAKGRIKNFLEGMEMGLAHINSMVLALVDNMGGKDGVRIWVAEDDRRRGYELSLSSKQIRGNYYNKVSIQPNVPSEQQQLEAFGMRLADGKYISHQTLRDDYLRLKAPTDEAQRVAFEEAMQSDELRPFRVRAALQSYFGYETMLQMLYNTELMPPPDPGYQWERTEEGNIRLVSERELMLRQQAPTDEELELPPPAAPAGAPPGMPPAPPAGMPPGMPGAPPQLPPQIQPPGVGTPQGGGIPPELQGQLTPEMMGNLDPATFAQLTGQPLDPQQEMAMLANGGPVPPPMP